LEPDGLVASANTEETTVKRKLTAALLGGAIILGSLGMTGVADASTAPPSRTSGALSGLLTRITEQCAARPETPLCRQFNRLTPAQINRAVAQVNLAVQRGGGTEAIRARLVAARATVCADTTAVLARVPARFKPQATEALGRLCNA